MISLRNTIVALNTAGSGLGPDLLGPMTSQGHNLVGKSDNSTGFTNGSNGDLVGTIAAPVNPLLGPLANYGGPTQTMALLPGSLALNAGDNAAIINPPFGGPPFTDQRGVGFNRIVNATVDIGAFESRGFTISATSGTPQSAQILSVFSQPLTATISSAFAEPVAGGVVTFTAPASGPRRVERKPYDETTQRKARPARCSFKAISARSAAVPLAHMTTARDAGRFK